MTHFAELQRASWVQAEASGFHDVGRSFGDVVALIHSELSEALEEFREGRGEGETYYRNGKPEGVGVEMADAVIRIMDWAEGAGVNLEALIVDKQRFNATRPALHGGKRL
jgi:hypothetical protein